MNAAAFCLRCPETMVFAFGAFLVVEGAGDGAGAYVFAEVPGSVAPMSENVHVPVQGVRVAALCPQVRAAGSGLRTAAGRLVRPVVAATTASSVCSASLGATWSSWAGGIDIHSDG